jgi:hypothetical protein
MATTARTTVTNRVIDVCLSLFCLTLLIIGGASTVDCVQNQHFVAAALYVGVTVVFCLLGNLFITRAFKE